MQLYLLVFKNVNTNTFLKDELFGLLLASVLFLVFFTAIIIGLLKNNNNLINNKNRTSLRLAAWLFLILSLSGAVFFGPLSLLLLVIAVVLFYLLWKSKH